MFCPECGIEDRQANQFCRACGADLSRVRSAIAAPDSVTAASVNARDEIGRAIAAKIRESRTADELAVVAEEVLPEVEKFLESPHERRMRRMRIGTLLSGIGLGAAVGISIVSQFMRDPDIIILAGLGVVCFFLGLAFVLNGLFLTVPAADVSDHSAEGDKQRALDGLAADTNELRLPPTPAASFASVTEHTTKHLRKEAR